MEGDGLAIAGQALSGAFLTEVLRSWAKFFISLTAATVIALHYAHPHTLGTHSPTTDAQTPATSATSSPVLLPAVPDAV